MQYGMSVMRGVLGSEGVEGVIEGGLGRGVEGGGEKMGGGEGKGKMGEDVGGKVRLGTGLDGVDERMTGMDVGESSEDEVFADAMEG